MNTFIPLLDIYYEGKNSNYKKCYMLKLFNEVLFLGTSNPGKLLYFLKLNA